MLARTHIVSSAAIAIPAFYIVAPNIESFSYYAPLLLAGVALGAMFPDIDEPQSYIGRRLLPFSTLLSLFIRHRTWAHSLVIWGVLFSVAVALWFFAPQIPTPLLIGLIGFFAGGFLHILGDAMTCASVPGMFYPFKKKPIWILPSFMRFRVGSPLEYVYFSIFLIILILFCCRFYLYFNQQQT
jgi:inner membrane protein